MKHEKNYIPTDAGAGPVALTVPADCPEMITFFNISGAMIYVDEKGAQVGYEDVWTKIEMCRRHYVDVGLGSDYVDQFVR